MTVPHVVCALVVGFVTGGLGWLISPGRDSFPVWLTMAIGVTAALGGTFAASLAGLGQNGLSLGDVLVQISVASAGVGLVAATTKTRRVTRMPRR